MSLSIQGGGEGRQRYLEQIAELQRRNQERMASALRIARAADDSAGLAIARRLEAAARGDAAGERNVAAGQDVVRTADAALETSQETVGRMRELSGQAQNGTLSDADRATIQQEFDQLSAQLDQIAGARFGGRALLDGSAQGADAVVVRDGAGGDTELPLPDARAEALGLTGLDASDPATVAALDAAGDALASARAGLGAADASLGRQQQALSANRVETEAARSRIEDLDLAQAVAEQTRDRILMDLQLAGQRVADRNHGRLLDLLG